MTKSRSSALSCSAIPVGTALKPVTCERWLNGTRLNYPPKLHATQFAHPWTFSDRFTNPGYSRNGETRIKTRVSTLTDSQNLGNRQCPRDATWPQIYGVALLCGIGFTMSQFIGGLAFGDASRQNDAAKLGVLLGSIVAAVTGYVHLRVAKPHDRSPF
ncbi:Na+/H+ antiporter NhaA [Sphingobium baderi]|uniref:Na+/H+ antiporter NhaA n=1 Tax=Sphingobium baderi TaxID=1332080 RepID=UPI003977CA54